MEAMLHQNIFKKMTIYDLQGLCKNVTEVEDPDDQSASAGLMTVGVKALLIEKVMRPE